MFQIMIYSELEIDWIHVDKWYNIQFFNKKFMFWSMDKMKPKNWILIIKNFYISLRQKFLRSKISLKNFRESAFYQKLRFRYSDWPYF